MSSTQGNSPLGWDDMVFEFRNKSYGAYFIRKVYNKNVLIAVLLALFTVSFGLAYPTIAELLKAEMIEVTKLKLLCFLNSFFFKKNVCMSLTKKKKNY